LCQAAITPSVIVSLKRGIKITSAIRFGCAFN
jgi:choline-glycine betaine transporter